MIAIRQKNNKMICRRVYIFALIALLSFSSLICQTTDDVATEEEISSEELVDSSDESVVTTPKTDKEEASRKKEPVPAPKTVAPSSGLVLLDITDALLYDSRVPDIELEKREVMIADIDEPSVEEVPDKGDNVATKNEVVATEDSTKKDGSFRTMNRAVKLWLPRVLIILLVLILIVLYNSKSKKKRRRVFRKIPSKRRL